ncbi:MAG: orotate phosphoribosyltransferase [Ruminococcus sp.]|jgi:orotate phosphoribosyltransferase|nr:orotate phosphoribosyltransferase [Ruminococcus sp.]
MDYKNKFIRFMYEAGVLKFGEFTLKSGRVAPYFINTGNYNTGEQILKLGEFYADCINANNIDANTLFGPAYKGIPLAVSAAAALFNKYGKNVYYCFDRKEIKDHGEGGNIVGRQLDCDSRICIIEDVITAGTAIRQTLPVLKGAAPDCKITAMVISVDRAERGKTDKSAVQEVNEEFGFSVYPIVTINDIIEALDNETIPGKEFLPKMLEYRAEYGVK